MALRQCIGHSPDAVRGSAKMLSNKQSMRSLVSFLVAWAFVVLTVTGIVLYVVPQGRIAYWVHWSLLGLEKTQWGWVHMMFGGVFIVSGLLHLYFNWNTFRTFIAGRVRGHLRPKREVLVATLLTVVIFIVSAADLPPASWVIDLNDRVKASWVTSPDLEPPFGHAEEISLAGLAARQRLDLAAVLRSLEQAGMGVEGPDESLESIARRNGITPMAVYAVVRDSGSAEPPSGALASRAELEARFAGTGLGRKTITELAAALEVEPERALQRLARAGVEAGAGDTARNVADAQGVSPIDIAALMIGLPSAP
jgi:hypothetical protein